MKANRKIKLLKADDSTYVMKFSSVRNVWLLYGDFIRSLNAISKKSEFPKVLLDFSEMKGPVYSSSAISISGIVDYYRDFEGWTFSFGDRSPRTYLQFTGFDHPINVSDGFDIIQNSAFNRVIRFNGSEEASILSNEIIRQLKKSVVCEEGVLVGLSWCINEILDNIFVHSGAKHGYMMVQIHNRKKVINVSIFDLGCGLFNSLRNSIEFSPKDEMEAIELAVKRGVTENKKIGQGNGLYGLGKIVADNHGHLCISTGHCMVEFDGEKNIRKEKAKMPVVSPEHHGTRIDFTINYQRKIDVVGALDGYTPLEPISQEIENMELDDGTVCINVFEATSGDVGSRQSGKRLRLDLLNTLKISKTPIALNFDSIDIITSSFADEVFGKTVALIGFTRFNALCRIINANIYVMAIVDRAIGLRQKDLFS